ncbi:MAG TPA: hypothetical protein VFX30_08195 [bacterium]|nr:hypothetical protein [bacterium]
MKAKRIVILWGILSLSLSALALSACGGSSEQTVEPAPDVVEGSCLADADCGDGMVCQEGGCFEAPAPEEEVSPAVVDCAAEGICEVGHECSVNAECGSKRCELTVGLCIESCNAGFTFWTANGSEAGTCIPTPHPHPVEGWM